MPFMIGKSPIRRTLKYLESCKVHFRENVKIFTVNFNSIGDHHAGARDFVYWYLSQIQYKNPNVQCLCFKNSTPSPFIKIFFDNRRPALIDMDSRKKEEILLHLQNFSAVCKTGSEIEKEKMDQGDKLSSAFFGYGCTKHCICEVFGQVPCPMLVPVPKIWKGMPDKNADYRVPPFYKMPKEKK